MPIEIEVKFNGAQEKLVDGVMVSVPTGRHEIVFELRTLDGNSNAAFEAPYIIWTPDPPPGAGKPEPRDGRQILRLLNDNQNPGPDSQTFNFQFVVSYDGQTRTLGNPDPAIINEPPSP